MPDWERKLLALTKTTVEAARAPGQFFGTKSGVLTFNKIPLNNNEMEVLITAQVFDNSYYPRPYDADKIESPDCFALARATPDVPNPVMVPSPNSFDIQNHDCASCPKAKFGTATTGTKKGKACRNMRRLSVIPAAVLRDGEAARKAPAGFIRLAVYSVKEWQQYVGELAKVHRSPHTVVTKMKLVPDVKAQHKFVFSFVSDITDRGVLEAVTIRNEMDEADMMVPYPVKTPEEAAQQATAPAGAPSF
jgi:transposase